MPFARVALLATAARALVAPVPAAQKAAPLASSAAELDGMIGTSIECGDVAWDPLELSQWRDVNEMRACELANGRAAMLGWVGWLWPQVFGLWQGGSVKTTDPIDAIMQVPTAAWCQFVVFCGAIEANKLNWEKGLVGSGVPEKPFFDPFGLYPEDAEGQKRMQLRELKNARTAMIGFAGLFVNHFMSGAVPGLGGFK
mmetsp:Transcript_10918/g.33722  ORF Transcript_10918/g.33722 Transcript_10918/m.33722 type:complete len:198 (+) Transcript_10918:70-663(+)